MNFKLLTLLALGLSFPDIALSQEVEGDNIKKDRLKGINADTTDLYRKDLRVYKRDGEEYKYNTFTSGRTDVHKFDNKERAFRDWAISLGGGANFMHRGDLTSFYNSKITPGYNVYVSLDKQITHAVGVSLQYQFGETKQRGTVHGLPSSIVYPTGILGYTDKYSAGRGVAQAYTKYHQVSLIGDVNLSNLFRRMDNFSTYRWAIHAYAGLGLQSYKTHLKDGYADARWSVHEMKQDLDLASFFYQGGVGLKFNVNRLIDLEARVMYIVTGDDEFDGGGDTREHWYGYNMIKKNDSDNFFTTNLGVSFKLGRKENETHLAWYDPMKEIYVRAERLGTPRTLVCENGDLDNDGVCDDWDRQLNTPAGARIDGAGVALDLDLDGVIDLDDKCVTVPGPVENHGCPETPEQAVVNSVNRSFEGVVFDLDKHQINKSSSTSTAKLNEAASVINSLNPIPTFYVIGATDTRGTEQYNQALSQKRANAVTNYLVNKGGVPKQNLIPVGRGEKDLKYPECEPASKCPEWKNEANRRVYIEQK